MIRTGLLLIDLQEEYLARPGLQPPRETLIAAIATALTKARAVDEPVFHIRTSGAPMPHREAAPDPTPPLDLAEQPGEPVFTKRFFSAFDAPGLDDALRAAGITRLRLAGLQAHACVHATALDAYAKGYEVEIDETLIASDQPAFAAQSLRWLDGRAATLVTSTAKTFQHRDPCDQNRILDDISLATLDEVRAAIGGLQAPTLPIEERAARLRTLHDNLSNNRDSFVEALITAVAKPRRDAEAEITYGLALLDQVASTLSTPAAYDARSANHHPVGLAGLITPWNNPFAIPLGKLAPAIGYGNRVIWKPALQGTAVARLLHQHLVDAGLADSLALITGGAATARAMIDSGALNLLSFTGSVPTGRAIIAAAGHHALPVQAELGGCNAAIVDSSADLDAAAVDLAAAMFSFAGQRCTAIRRVILLADIADGFTDRITAEIAKFNLGDPSDPATHLGPVIDRAAQQRFLALAGTTAPANLSASGCWVAPTLLHDLPADHPLLTEEVFGPLAAIQTARDLDHAIHLHNASDYGLVGAIFTSEASSETRFLAKAQAGMLSINRARPAFSPAGPFVGWKSSAFGPPEHGRWNRDTYTRTQAHYRPGSTSR